MNQRYNAGRRAFGEGLNWTRATIAAVLVSKAYVFSASHRSLDAITGIIGEPVDLEDRVMTDDGYAKASLVRFHRVLAPAGVEAAGVIVFRRGGELIAFYDEVSDFPKIPNGGDIDVDWEDDQLFRL